MKYTKKQIEESIKYWEKVLESFEESQSLNEGGEWIQKEPKTLEEHINALESLVSDLVYELDERGGYPLLDDAISVAKDTFKRLRQLANVDDTPSYVIGEAAKRN